MRARQRAPGNAVAVDVEIAAELAARLQLGGRHDLAAVELARIVPLERRAEMRIHADVEIEHDEDRRLQPIGEIEGERAELEGFAWPFGQQQHVLGVAVRGEGARQDVRLLRARRHAGRRAAALHVEDDERDLGEIGEAEKFLHQRNARARRGREGARAIPARADRHADRRDLVLGLNDRVALLACRAIDAQASRNSVSKASASEVEGVIGYQAQTVAPP